ncbi:hypothetical protein BRDID11004_19450 [Bradyrhizobium diazoefficiens]|uniref:Uncharacterized protein n=1 Tax=Bradyrhizobium diazoefficiens TaxID=1355477 RepID=A0A810A6X4_9BRAD|nr:hypothetical protein F07S3_69740 [Bradyrhizobium diazoefficiens]BCA06198.1 hypothetical protein H12S4_71020 [Bradyrhizobium diazoefficiens]BCA14827.1 hypothetical protein BDHF08_66740 [Bradyrhizobium diazoefficiens]BCA23550.1 hypothetical protein BDHH15_67650 [Bradyrhizobium diazoefficiens]BCE32930.1 hypothetical protein XF2B_66990 [Bradyrhizobium diazoefficiens]
MRRRFYELHVNESSHLANQTVTTKAELWAIEAEILCLDPDTRVKVSLGRSAAIATSADRKDE